MNLSVHLLSDSGNSGKASARVLFENRSLQVNSGMITDHLAPFGSQVYLINLKRQSDVPLNFRKEILSKIPDLKIFQVREYLQPAMPDREVTGVQHIFLIPGNILKEIILSGLSLL